MASSNFTMSTRKRKSTDISGICEAEINLISEDEEVENCAPDAKLLKIQDEEKQAENREILQVVEGKSENASISGSTEDFIVISRTSVSASVTELEECKVVENASPVDLNINKNNESIASEAKEAQLSNENVIRQEIVEISDKAVAAECSKLSTEHIIAENPLEDGEVLEVEDSISIPHITVKFRDKFIADIYKKKILKLFKSFVELNIQETEADDTILNIFKVDDSELNGLIVVDDALCINEEVIDESTGETPKSGKKRKRRRKKSISESNQLFVVDTKPATENSHKNQTKYSSKFLLNEQKHSEGDNLKSVCYNCEKDHAIKDCPLPKNYVKINANRMKMQTTRIKTTRYHLDEQKYDYLQPGKISKELRKALGLKKNQIPCYIYQMRSMGYPPGWLEEAQYTTSDLTMFDIEGKNVKNTNPAKIQGLDPEKVIEYPGFNAPLGKEFKDEYKYFRVPPYSEQINRENMIKHFQTLAEGSSEVNLAIEDMDLDCNSDIAENVDKPEHIEELIVIDDDAEDALAPESLQELEKQKNSILEEIKNAAEITACEKVPLNDSTNKKSVDEAEEEEEVAAVPSDSVKTPEIEENSKSLDLNEENSVCVNLDITPNNQSIKNSIFGTPVLKSNSPYNRLPEAGKFMNGISPMIDFENLPNTTGKYEQMTNVLQKVRDTLKTLQK